MNCWLYGRVGSCSQLACVVILVERLVHSERRSDRCRRRIVPTQGRRANSTKRAQGNAKAVREGAQRRSRHQGSSECKRTLPFGIAADCTPEQAFAVVELLDLRELIYAHYLHQIQDQNCAIRRSASSAMELPLAAWTSKNLRRMWARQASPVGPAVNSASPSSRRPSDGRASF